MEPWPTGFRVNTDISGALFGFWTRERRAGTGFRLHRKRGRLRCAAAPAAPPATATDEKQERSVRLLLIARRQHLLWKRLDGVSLPGSPAESRRSRSTA